MYIVKQLQSDVITQRHMSNEEFLQHEIYELYNIFRDEMFSIKNIDLEYVAISEKFAEEFGLDASYLGSSKSMPDGVNGKIQADMIEQERGIIEELSSQYSAYFYKKDNKVTFCAMRKRRLINPFTKDVVGIFIVATKVDPGIVRKHMVKNLFQKPAKYTTEIPTNLTKQQQQIIFCILLGFHSRKEISGLLTQMTNEKYSETRIKNALQGLYQKFECNTTSGLLTMISHDQIKIDFPAGLVLEGSYPVREKK